MRKETRKLGLTEDFGLVYDLMRDLARGVCGKRQAT